MPQKFLVVGKASIPLEEGGTVAPIDIAVDMTVVSRADFSRSYTEAVTNDVVDLGTLTGAGARGVLVKCASGSCTVKFNSQTQAWPLSIGGIFLWANPSTPFPTSAEITTTGAALIVFLAVG